MPVSVDGVVWKIREESLVHVENPRILALGRRDRERARVLDGLVGDDVGVRGVPGPIHVILYEFDAAWRDGLPDPGVVVFDGKLPTFAVKIVAVDECHAVGDLRDRLQYTHGSRRRRQGGEESEREEHCGRDPSHRAAKETLPP